MITLNRCCDVCGKSIVNFEDYREVSLIKRDNWDCIVDNIWEFDLCQKCSLGIERDIRRKIKMKKVVANEAN